MPERLDWDELAQWRGGRNAVYQLAALTLGERLAVAGSYKFTDGDPPQGSPR